MLWRQNGLVLGAPARDTAVAGREKSVRVIRVIRLMLFAALAVVVAQPALAASANVYRGGAYYRALLLRAPPGYWLGGTVWTPLAPIVYPPRAAGAPTQPSSQPVTRRVPEPYVAAAHRAPPSGPLWVKTAKGFRLESTP